MKPRCIHCQTKAMTEIHGWLPVCGQKCAAVIDSLPSVHLQKLIDAKRKAEKPKSNKPKKTKSEPESPPPVEETPKLVRILKLKKKCQIVFYYTSIKDCLIELGRHVTGKTVTYYVGFHIHYGSGDMLVGTLNAIAQDYRAFLRGKPPPIKFPEAVPFESVIPTEEEPLLPIVLTTSDDEDLFGTDESSSEMDLFGSEEEYDLPKFASESDEDEVELEDIVFSDEGPQTSNVPQTPTPPVVPTPPPSPIPPKDVVQPPKKKETPKPKVKKDYLERLVRRAKTEFAKDTKTLNIILSLIEASKKYRLLPNSYPLIQRLNTLKYDWAKKKTPEFFKENINAKAIIWVMQNGKKTKLQQFILTGMYESIFETVTISVSNVDRFIELYPNAFNVKTVGSEGDTITLTYKIKSAEHHMFFAQFVSVVGKKILEKVDMLCFAERVGLQKEIMKTILKEAKLLRDDNAVKNGMYPFAMITETPFQILELSKDNFVVVGENVKLSTQDHSEGALRLYYSQIRPFLHRPSENFQPDDRFASLLQKFIIDLTPNATIFPLLIEVLTVFDDATLTHNFAHWMIHVLYKKVNKYAITIKTRLDVNTKPGGILVEKNAMFEDPSVTTLYDVEPYFKRTVWTALRRIMEMQIPFYAPRKVDTNLFLTKTALLIKIHFPMWFSALIDVEKLEPKALMLQDTPFSVEIENLQKVNLEDPNLAHIQYADPEGTLELPGWAV